MKTPSRTYLGTVPVGNDKIVTDVIRVALRGTGFSLRKCGRNPNRKQFYDQYPRAGRPANWNPVTQKWGSRTQRGGLQQDLPLRCATSVALYLKGTSFGYCNPNTTHIDKINEVKMKILTRLALVYNLCGNRKVVMNVKKLKAPVSLVLPSLISQITK